MTKQTTLIDHPEPPSDMATLGERSIAQLLGRAIDQLGGEGAAAVVEAIKGLVQLRREEEDRRAKRDFFRDLAAFRKVCPTIHKSKTADMTTRSGGKRVQTYADLAGIEAVVRSHLYPLGFSWRWDSEPEPEGRRVKVTCVLMHAGGHEERATVVVPVDAAAPMNDTQKHGSTFTYGQRYSLIQVLGLSTADEDTDGIDPAKLVSIDAKQAGEIDLLIQNVGADKARFLNWLGAKTVEEIPLADYDRAVAMLQKKGAK